MIDKALKLLLWVLDRGTNFWVRNVLLVALFSATALAAWPYMAGKEIWIQLLVAMVIAFMIILSYSALTYFALSLVDSLVTFLPRQHFSVKIDFERAKAKLVKGLVERELQFSLNPVDQYSPGLDQGIFAAWRKRLFTTKPPFIAVSRNPFIVIKLAENRGKLEKIRKAIDSEEVVDVLAVADPEDSTALSFLKYLETSLRGPPGTRAEE